MDYGVVPLPAGGVHDVSTAGCMDPQRQVRVHEQRVMPLCNKHSQQSINKPLTLIGYCPDDFRMKLTWVRQVATPVFGQNGRPLDKCCQHHGSAVTSDLLLFLTQDTSHKLTTLSSAHPPGPNTHLRNTGGHRTGRTGREKREYFNTLW